MITSALGPAGDIDMTNLQKKKEEEKSPPREYIEQRKNQEELINMGITLKIPYSSVFYVLQDDIG